MRKTAEKKDTVEKDFVAFPDIAADVINVLLYQGEAVADAGKLLAGPTETVYQGQERLRSQYEDICKYQMEETSVSIMYLIANQSRTDGKMLLRKAGYTGGIYREQYKNKLSEVFPVIELVLYWGRPRWRGKRDLLTLCKTRKVPEKAWNYVDELKLHVFEMRYLPSQTRELFQSDMRIVVDFLAEGKGYRSNQKVVHKAALIRMIKVLSGETDTGDIERWMEEQGIKEEDEITMCELFDQYVRQGKNEGKIEGKIEERISIVCNMLREGLDRELIRRITGCSASELMAAGERCQRG